MKLMAQFKSISTGLGIVMALLYVVSTPYQVHAADPSSWVAGNIIDDANFLQSDSMTVVDIQNFLNSKVPSCDINGLQTSSFSAPDYNSDGRISRAEYGKYKNNPIPFTCLRDYREVPKTQPGAGIPANNYGNVSGNSPAGSQSAAEIIWNAAHDFNINPKVLLVTLQKESGLLTDDWPFKSQLVYAMGAHCPDSGPGGSANCDANYSGFSMQIRESAGLFRYYLDNMQQSWWTNKRPYQSNYIQYDVDAGCGGTNVLMENKATTALYVYTPYQPTQAALNAGYGSAEPCGAYGNRNFWLYYNDWFGPTRGTILLQSPASPAVYLLSGAVRYGIPSGDVLNAYGLGGVKVTPVTDAYMNSLPDGGVLSTTFKKDGSDAVYMTDNGYRFGFATYQQCVDWGFPNCLTSASKSLAPSVFNQLRDAGSMKPLMLTGSTVFLMQNGEKRPFLSGKAMSENSYSNADIVPVTNRVNNSQPVGFSLLENNSFVKFSSQDAIYYYNQGKFYTLTYQAYRTLANNKVVFTDGYSKYITSPPSSEYTVLPLLKIDDGRSFLLTNGQKFDISATATNWPAQQLSSGLELALTAQPTLTVDTSSTFRSTKGAIFDVKNGEVRPFYSMNDYFATSNNPITLGDEILTTIPTGAYILAPGAGSIYQVTTPGKEYAIYTLSTDGSVCQITAMNQVGDFHLNTDAVKRIPEIGGSIKQLTSVIADSVGNLYIVQSGRQTKLSQDTLATYWGVVGSGNGCIFSSPLIGSIPKSSQSFSRFMRAANGVIYYGDSGQKHPIYSYAAFLRLGGNSSNTPTVPQSLLDLSPTGAPITQ